MRILVFLVAFAFCGTVFAQIPSDCQKCLSECPHDSKDLKPCDRGCKNLCSDEQVAEWNNVQVEKNKTKKCYECMSECPHKTKDLKSCDKGCADDCDRDSLVGAFAKLNGDFKKCSDSSGKKTKDKISKGVKQ
jgi:hypothetical protein